MSTGCCFYLRYSGKFFASFFQKRREIKYKLTLSKLLVERSGESLGVVGMPSDCDVLIEVNVELLTAHTALSVAASARIELLLSNNPIICTSLSTCKLFDRYLCILNQLKMSNTYTLFVHNIFDSKHHTLHF